MKKQKPSFFNLHLTSNISIALVLFMVGLLTWLLLTVTHYAHRSQENISVSIQLDDSITHTDLTRLESYIKVTPISTHYIYISKDSALTELTETLGDDPTSMLGYNPINASIEVYLSQRYANVDSIQKVVIPKFKSFSGVTDIIYEQDMIELMDNNIRRLLFFISMIVVVLLFISVVLINNTIRLTIYSKRFIINTMRLVGARNKFIRAPFIRKAMVNALIGALIGIVLLAASLYFMQIQINGYTNLAELFDPTVTVPVAAIMIVVSLVINYFATLFAVNRYLRMSTDKLYFV
ncbi:MAG: permease-like cell division protein FtsX [Paludibacteraceae bacterium]|nr:permease-like cell division protein FtsX [Candidatus Colousia faecequi]MCQ2337771.1 permease-like cell division protein FtsX [Paludibacteraceae bacterium]